MKSIVYATAVLLVIAAPDIVSAEKFTAVEQARISALMYRSLEAGRMEAEVARTNEQLSTDDRRDAQGQFALMLMTMEQCPETLRFVRDRNEIMAGGIKILIGRALDQDNQACTTSLAALMVERSNDSHFTPAGRIGLRFQAAAYLDAAGSADARAIMDKAQAEMLALPDSDALWAARWDALDAYEGKPGYMMYLEYLANRMSAERLPPHSQKGRSILALLAGKGRCDLVEQVMHQGPASCDQPKRQAEGIYINPRAPDWVGSEIEQLRTDTPSIGDDNLRRALAGATPRMRLFRLLQLIEACKKALAPS